MVDVGLEFDVTVLGDLNDALSKFANMQTDIKTKLKSAAEGIDILLKSFDGQSANIASMKTFATTFKETVKIFEGVPKLTGINAKFTAMGQAMNSFFVELLKYDQHTKDASLKILMLSNVMQSFRLLAAEGAGLTQVDNILEGAIKAAKSFSLFLDVFKNMKFPKASISDNITKFKTDYVDKLYEVSKNIKKMKDNIDNLNIKEGEEDKIARFTNFIRNMFYRLQELGGDLVRSGLSVEQNLKPIDDMIKVFTKTMRVVKNYVATNAEIGVALKSAIADGFTRDIVKIIRDINTIIREVDDVIISNNALKDLGNMGKYLNKLSSIIDKIKITKTKAEIENIFAVFDVAIRGFNIVNSNINTVKIVRKNRLKEVTNQIKVVVDFLKSKVFQNLTSLDVNRLSKNFSNFVIGSLPIFTNIAELLAVLEKYKSKGVNIFRGKDNTIKEIKEAINKIKNIGAILQNKSVLNSMAKTMEADIPTFKRFLSIFAQEGTSIFSDIAIFLENISQLANKKLKKINKTDFSALTKTQEQLKNVTSFFTKKTFAVIIKFLENTTQITQTIKNVNMQNASKELSSFLVEFIFMIENMTKLFKKLDTGRNFGFNFLKKENTGISLQQVNKFKDFTQAMLGIIEAFRTLSINTNNMPVENIVDNLNKIRRMLSATAIFNIGGFKGIVKSVSQFKSEDIAKFSKFAEAVVNIGKVFRVLGNIDKNIEVETVIRSLGTIRRMLNGIPLLPFGGFKSIMRDIGGINKGTVDKFRTFSESILAIAKTLEKLQSVNTKEINFKSFANSVKQLKRGMEAGGFKKGMGFALGKSFAEDVNRGAKKGWGIFSPSAVFRGFGQNIVQGLSRGLDTVVEVIRRFAKLVTDAFRGVTNTAKNIFGGIGNIILAPFKAAANGINGAFAFVFNRLRFAMNDLRQFTGGIGSIIAGTAIEFEKGLAQVFKTIEIPEESKKEIQARLTQQFREMATGDNSVLSGLEGASSTILEIAEVAGTLGISIDKMEQFTQTVGAMTIATNLGGEAAATFLGQFAAITGNTDFDKTASTMVTLGNQFAATESGIAEFSNRIAGVGVSFGFSVPEILAFSAAMESVGLNPEAGGTAFSQIMQKGINALSKGGTELELFARAAGMTGAELKELQKQKPAEFILEMLKGFSQYPLDEQVVLFDQLGLDGIRVSDTLRRLGNANELVAKSLDVANTGWRENTALMDEARIRNETTDASIQRMKNRFLDLKITIGNIFAPLVKTIADNIGEAVLRINGFLQNLLGSFNAIKNPIDQLQGAISGLAGGGDSTSDKMGGFEDVIEFTKSKFDPMLGVLQEIEIKQGDSIWGIAQRYGVTVDQILEWNNMTRDSVYHYGDVIKVWSDVDEQGNDITESFKEQYEALVDLATQNKKTNRTYEDTNRITRVLGKNLNIEQISGLRNNLRGLNKDFSDSKKAIGLLFSGETEDAANKFSEAIGGMKNKFKNILDLFDINITENPFIKRISALVDEIKNKNWDEVFKQALLVPISAFQALLSGGLNQFGFGERNEQFVIPLENTFGFREADTNAELGSINRTKSLFGFNEELAKRIEEIGKPETLTDSINLAVLNMRRTLTEIANGDYTSVSGLLSGNMDSLVRGAITTGLGLVFGVPFGAIAFVSNMLAVAVENDILGFRTALEKTEIGTEIANGIGFIGEQINIALSAISDIVLPQEKIGIIPTNFNIAELTAGSASGGATKASYLSFFNQIVADIQTIIDEVALIDFTSITTFVSGVVKFINDLVIGIGTVIGGAALLELKVFILPLIENIGKAFNTLVEEFSSDDINSLLKIGAGYILFMNRLKVASTIMAIGKFAAMQLLIGGIAESLPKLLEATSGAFGIIEGLMEGDSDKVRKNADKALGAIGEAIAAFFGSLANSTFNIMEAIGLGPADKFRIQAENSLRGIIAIIDTIITRIKIAALDLQIFNELDPEKEKPFLIERDKLISGLVFGEQFRFSTLELDKVFGFTNSFGELITVSFRDAITNPNNYILSGEAKERLRYAAINTLLTSGDIGSTTDAFNVFRLLGIDPETQFTTEQLSNLPFLTTLPTNLKDAILRNVALGELGLDQESILPFLTTEGLGGFFDSFVNGLLNKTELSEEAKQQLVGTTVSAIEKINENNALENALMTSEAFSGFNLLSLLAFPGNVAPGETKQIADFERQMVVDELLTGMQPIVDQFGSDTAILMYSSVIEALINNQEDAISTEDAMLIAQGFYGSLMDPEIADRIEIPRRVADTIYEKLYTVLKDNRGQQKQRIMDAMFGEGDIFTNEFGLEYPAGEKPRDGSGEMRLPHGYGDSFVSAAYNSIVEAFNNNKQLGTLKNVMYDGIALKLEEQDTAGGGTRLSGVGTNIALTLMEGVEKKLEIKSPSKVFAGYGEDIIMGVEKGVDDNLSTLTKSVENIVRELETVAIMTAVMANRVAISLSGIVLGLVVFNSTFALSTTILKLNLLTMRSDLDLFIDKIEDAILALARMRLAFAVSGAGNDPNYGFQPTDGTQYYGGAVRSDGKYEILENNLPFETYRTSKGKTYLISNENGQIYSPAKTRQVNAAAGVGMSRTEVNEGDVYITVNGSGNPEAVAEAVMKKLEKEKARGTMRTLRLSGASGV